MNINCTNKTNFKAKIIAKSGKITICKLNSAEDIKFLQDFCKRTDYKKLMPQLSEREAERWHEMLEYATFCAKNPGNTTYIELLNNKLWGIVTCFQNPTTIIDCICSIPVNIGEKVKLAGKTLFFQIFKDFVEYRGKRMKLSAITNGPYNTINKYKDLGFKETSNITKTYVEMDANQYAIKNSLKKLEDIIPYRPVPERKIDLKEFVIN